MASTLFPKPEFCRESTRGWRSPSGVTPLAGTVGVVDNAKPDQAESSAVQVRLEIFLNQTILSKTLNEPTGT
jgi:hypothetical protein